MSSCFLVPDTNAGTKASATDKRHGESIYFHEKKNQPGKARYWNYTIHIGSDHLIWEEDDGKLLKQMRGSWDEEADACLEELEKLAEEDSNLDVDDRVAGVKTHWSADVKGTNHEGVQEDHTETFEKAESETTATTAAAALGVNVAPAAETIPTSAPQPQMTRSPAPRNHKKHRQDFYEMFECYHDRSPALRKLWRQVNTVPEWVDWDEIARGQDVFYRYAGPMFVGLTYSSLLGGLGAARVAEVLARTGGFNAKVVKERLYETTQFILEVTRGVESMMPASMFPHTDETPSPPSEPLSFSTEDIRSLGWKSCIRVRFLHAAVRRRILALTKTHPNYYNTTANGIPINDLHSIGTIVTFAPWLLFRSLPRQGIFPTPSETSAYLALWRLVAYILGCPTDPYFSTPSSSRTIMEVLMIHEIDPSPLSRVLADNILTSLSDTAPAYPSRPFLEASARWINGHDVCDRLGLSRPRPFYYVLVAGQCLFFMVWTYWHRLSCRLLDTVETSSSSSSRGQTRDRRRIAHLRRLCWLAIVESRYGLQGQRTDFAFKYVPEVGAAVDAGPRTTTSPTHGSSGRWVKFEEKRALKTLVVVGGVLALGVGCGAWMVGRAVVWMLVLVLGREVRE